MRLGLIGLGRIGAFHADTLSHLDGVDSLVVTDAVPAVTASVAERFGAEAAESPAALISSGVDGIVIAAATDAHTALIRAGVDAGIPVFCEKPLSGVVEEAIAIADYVNASGVPVQIGYPRRFDPAYLAARNAVAERRARLGAHRAVDHPGPGTAAAGVHRRLRRDLPRLLGPRLRHRAVGHRPRGRRGLRHRQRPR